MIKNQFFSCPATHEYRNIVEQKIFIIAVAFIDR